MCLILIEVGLIASGGMTSLSDCQEITTANYENGQVAVCASAISSGGSYFLTSPNQETEGRL